MTMWWGNVQMSKWCWQCLYGACEQRWGGDAAGEDNTVLSSGLLAGSVFFPAGPTTHKIWWRVPWDVLAEPGEVVFLNCEHFYAALLSLTKWLGVPFEFPAFGNHSLPSMVLWPNVRTWHSWGAKVLSKLEILRPRRDNWETSLPFSSCQWL